MCNNGLWRDGNFSNALHALKIKETDALKVFKDGKQILLITRDTPKELYINPNYIERIKTIYAKENDMTFIMKVCDDQDVETHEVIGFYFGEPNEEATCKYQRELKAIVKHERS